ncbi:MAG TPA: hypothetical protein VE960_07190, partial [bacterium]|nr:hypothetical protein [bacterium]
GIGVLLPSQLLDVAGTVRAEGLQMPTGAAAGYVLTSDAGGNGAWTAPPSLTDDDWTISGDTVYHLDGDVGIGTASPLVDFEIRRDQDAYTGMVITNTDTGINSREGIIFKNEDGETAGLQLYDEGSPVGAGMVLSNNRPNGYLRFNTSGSERMRVDTDGRVGIGVLLPSQLLDVAGTARVEGFQMLTGATTGYVLTSDGSGYGTWTPPQAVPDGDWTVSGNSMSSSVSGNVGIGTANPQDKLEIKGVLRLDQGAGNGNNIRFAEGGDLKWAILYRPWVDGNLTILDEVSLARSMTFESGTGDVGVKTEHPETDFHVVGDARIDGDLEVNGSIIQSAATQYLTIQAADFVANDPAETRYWRTAESIYTNPGFAVSFAAPVHMPHGATVVAVTHYFVDSSSQDSACTFSRFSFPGSYNYQIADVPSSGSAGAGVATDTSPTWPVIDNTAYTYSVALTARDSIETESVVIEYTTTTVD